MIKIFLAIAFGGAMGAMTRYGAHVAFTHITKLDGFWGTLVINVIGSFIMGALASFWCHDTQLARAFVAIGFLGSFSTFSTFSLDALTLITDGRIWSAAIYISASVIVSITALAGGFELTRLWWEK